MPYPYLRDVNEQIDMYEFSSYEEAYHQLMIELCDFTVESVKLIIPAEDETSNIFITGGFSKNELFLKLISNAYTSKKVYTSEIKNSTALGAALVISGKLNPEKQPDLNLGLNRC